MYNNERAQKTAARMEEERQRNEREQEKPLRKENLWIK